MKPYHLSVPVFAVLAMSTVTGAEQRTRCPDRLGPEAIKPDRPPPDWELHMLRPVYLTEGGMLHGPPDESAFLVPDSSTSQRTGTHTRQTQHWSFDVPHGYSTWMYCGYGGGGATLKLFKQVAEHATECTLFSESTDGHIKDSVEFVCR